MKRCLACFIVIITLLLNSITPAYAISNADADRLNRLYLQRNYSAIMKEAPLLLNKDHSNPEINLLLGQSYTQTLQYSDAVPYLKTADSVKSDGTIVSWCDYYLGLCYFMMNNNENAKRYLEKCMTSDTLPEARDSAKTLFGKLNFGRYFDNWTTESSEHFVFHFHPSFSNSQKDYFVKSREAAYDTINCFFKSRPVKKIDMYVWDRNDSAKKILNMDLGYTLPELALINTLYHQTKGHEITHVLSYWFYPERVKTAFLDEGTSTYFNQLGNEELTREKDAMSRIKNGEIKDFDLESLWENNKSGGEFSKYPDSYFIAAAFVRYLIKEGGPDKFKELLKNETYINAKAVYGNDLDRYMKGFYDQYGLKDSRQSRVHILLYIIVILVAISVTLLLITKRFSAFKR